MFLRSLSKLVNYAFVALCVLASIEHVSSQQPSMVYIINRHGVREPRDTSVHEGGAQLLNSAYERLYTKGVNIRSHYPTLLSSMYKPSELRVNSSSWERTINTAQGIIAGLYASNITMNVPVFSTPWESDYTIYNYDKCPGYDKTWADFQLTTEWNDKKVKYANLTTYLNGLLQPSKPITLSTLFSTWDLYWIQRNRPEANVQLPTIDDYTYKVLSEATQWVESMRYSARISGTYLGSTLLAAIKYRMERYIAQDAVFGHKMIISSAHYATQLNVLASLGYTGKVVQTIPDYNSVLVFELYNGTNGWYIKINYHDGTWVNASQMIPISLGSCSEGVSCSYEYGLFWNTYKVKNLQQWCQDCESQLSMCVGANANSTNASSSSSCTNGSTTYVSDIVEISKDIKAQIGVIVAFCVINLVVHLFVIKLIKSSSNTPFIRGSNV